MRLNAYKLTQRNKFEMYYVQNVIQQLCSSKNICKLTVPVPKAICILQRSRKLDTFHVQLRLTFDYDYGLPCFFDK